MKVGFATGHDAPGNASDRTHPMWPHPGWYGAQAGVYY
jgi:hypothetical protein